MACEDFPCCGHELGDCEGRKYGSDESIKTYAMAHVGCDHEAGVYDCAEYGSDEEDEEPDTMTCPEHGEQEVKADYGDTGGSDPYAISRLACGHKVFALGPDPQDMVITEMGRPNL